jgi:hypothetical protein
MGQLAIPMMIGAAVGGGSKLIQGKGLGSILKGAAVGGALGGATGGIGGLMSEGAAAGTSSLGNATEGLLSTSGLPSFAGVGGMPSIALDGSAMGALDNAALAQGTTGLTNSLIPTMDLANSTGATSLSMLDKLKQYGTIDNLKGAAMVANQFQPQQQPMIQGGGSVKVGQAPTGDIYDELRKVGYTLPKRRETNFSLLG